MVVIPSIIYEKSTINSLDRENLLKSSKILVVNSCYKNCRENTDKPL